MFFTVVPDLPHPELHHVGAEMELAQNLVSRPRNSLRRSFLNDHSLILTPHSTPNCITRHLSFLGSLLQLKKRKKMCAIAAPSKEYAPGFESGSKRKLQECSGHRPCVAGICTPLPEGISLKRQHSFQCINSGVFP